MNIVTATAIANLKTNKTRNLLIGIAIALTTLLLTIIPMVLFGFINLRFAAVNQVYPTFHAIYREVDEANAAQMKKDARLAEVGLREDVGVMVLEEADTWIPLMWVDGTAQKLNKLSLECGVMPQKANEIVVSYALLEALGQSGEIGDTLTVNYQLPQGQGLGIAQTRDFVITGFTADSDDSKNQSLTALVSEAFAQEVLSKEQHEYRVYFTVADVQQSSTDFIEETIEVIAEEYGVQKENTVMNSEYLFANYVDPALLSGMVLVEIVIVLAGILSIYSIYYVSMQNKVQQFGHLRAIGATRIQIRSLILREGLLVAVIAEPVGLLIGSIGALLLLKGSIDYGVVGDNLLGVYMLRVWEQRSVTLVQPWILLTAAFFTFVAVYISLLKPMRIAARISPVEAIRYQWVDASPNGKKRKGYAKLGVGKLVLSNLGRNRKRTVVTIVTLAMTGVLFMVVATLLNCVNPKTMAESWIRADVVLGLDYSVGDAMHPERELNRMQMNNPLSELSGTIQAMEGVRSVKEGRYVLSQIHEVKEEGEPLWLLVEGLSPDEMTDAKVLEGSLEAPELYDGSGIIMMGNVVSYMEGEPLQLHSVIHMDFYDGEKVVKKEFHIAAVVENSYGLEFALPEEVMNGMLDNNPLTYLYVDVEDNREAEVNRQIRSLLPQGEVIQMDTFAEQYELAQKSIGFMMYAGYGILFVLGMIGILNLINTMIHSVHVRRREIGMLQAIGLSGRQTVRILQLEGLFYTFGTLVVSIGFGSLLGYWVFLWARDHHIMTIQSYHYPMLPALVLAGIVLAVQVLITCFVNRNLKKASIIDRIRFAE